MKKHFVINPAAGRGKYMYSVIEKVRTRGDNQLDFSVYVTGQIGDAEKYCREISELPGEHLFIVCGGDGTICEALNGIEGRENCALAVMPAGTGNDFIRNFYNTNEEKELFSDVDAQFAGEEILCDYMEVIIDGERRKLAINMLNSGLDSEVGVRVNEIRGKKVVPQKLAYYYGLIEQFIKKPHVNARVTVDGKELFDGEKILIAIGNGAYCGGGFKAATKASLCDGLLDVCIVDNVTRLQFIDLVGSYKKGTHLEHKRAKDLITYLQCREITVEYANPQNVVFDGEAEVCNSICVRVSEKPVRVFLPKGVSLRGVTPEDHDAVLNVEDIADVANSATEERVEETAEV